MSDAVRWACTGEEKLRRRERGSWKVFGKSSREKEIARPQLKFVPRFLRTGSTDHHGTTPRNSPSQPNCRSLSLHRFKKSPLLDSFVDVLRTGEKRGEKKGKFSGRMARCLPRCGRYNLSPG